MKEFQFTVSDKEGLHARPAGVIVAAAKKFSSAVTIEANGKTGDAKRLLAVMSMGIKFGAQVVVRVSGEDEQAAADEMKKVFEANL